ncbi:MAG: serpin family protein [Candidatus Omnitrophica bacterium]|nr:serpin family protein [Candidatus Omnitrophota bacterium]
MKRRAKIVFLFLLSLLCASGRLYAQDQTDAQILAEGNNMFALDLYGQLQKASGNLFFSPYSISSALAMTYVGASGQTASQMADVLHFELDETYLHNAFSELMTGLDADPQEDAYQLSIANALWAQMDYEFYDDFINITKNYYNAGFEEVDFVDDVEREAARQKINLWVEDKTDNKIKDLIAKDTLDALTRLVLTNAIYFKGNWASRFDPANTQDRPFTLSNGREVEVPMMKQQQEFNYSANDMLQVLEMPYDGQALSMVIILPKEVDGLEEVEGSFTIEDLEDWLAPLRKREVSVSMPKFKMSDEFLLGDALKTLGMRDAFSSKSADFSKMAPDPVGLYISSVIHKAFVEVNEEGTEAAAATAVTMKIRGMPEPAPVFKADHPFIFVIRDIHSESILFIGRVMDPRD